MQVVPDMLNNAFAGKNYLLFFPGDEKLEEDLEKRSVSNHDDFTEISNMIGKIFK
ncbi:MAG TPA: hypothetical protein PKJ36_06375 [Flavihumibacter sp.]|nr:hypothetical protein [Flavihumibacter sp.]